MCFKKSSKLNYFQITIIIFRYKNQNQSPTVTINKCDLDEIGILTIGLNRAVSYMSFMRYHSPHPV